MNRERIEETVRLWKAEPDKAKGKPMGALAGCALAPLRFPAYHRISTVIFVPAQSGSAVEMVTM